jgi:hypothetical protein
MDDSGFNRAYLESLTTRELIRMADRFGIDIPPDLERIFIIEELVDLAPEDEPESPNSSEPLKEADFSESVPLPKQYNITFIEVLPRDPLWVFTFWEVKSHDKEFYERVPDFIGYHLKVCPRGPLDRAGPDSTFTVLVGNSDTAWYLGFPPLGGCYQVELCAVREGEETVLAVSHPFKMPKLLNPPKTPGGREIPKGEGINENPLACLSGVKDFPVLRNGDRLSRRMRSCSSGVTGV